MKKIHKGDKVRVIRIAHDADKLTREHVSCFLGKVGVVKTEPQWLAPEPEKGPLGKVIAYGECWVEFDEPCAKHGDTGAVYEVAELELLE